MPTLLKNSHSVPSEEIFTGSYATTAGYSRPSKDQLQAQPLITTASLRGCEGIIDGLSSGLGPAGLESKKPVVSWKDMMTLTGVMVFAVVSILAIYLQTLAVQMGQTNQLIVVGLCLAVMAMGTHRQVRLAGIMYEVQTKQLSIQSFQSLLCMDMFERRGGYRAPSIVALLTLLPLALSVGYKRFIGGTSAMEIAAPALGAPVGMTYPPGYQKIGIGITMVILQYIPFWLDPRVNATYGFALYIESNTTAAILDTPSSSFLTNLQKSLGEEDHLLLSARVNATVSESMPFTGEELSDAGWNETRSNFSDWNIRDMFFGHYVLTASGDNLQLNNHSRTIVSICREPNQTAKGQARQLYTTRREAFGTWKITSTNVTLESAHLFPMTDIMRSPLRQKVIQDNTAGIDPIFLQEYDYLRNPRPTDIDTTPALIATLRLLQQRFGQLLHLTLEARHRQIGLSTLLTKAPGN